MKSFVQKYDPSTKLKIKIDIEQYEQVKSDLNFILMTAKNAFND